MNFENVNNYVHNKFILGVCVHLLNIYATVVILRWLLRWSIKKESPDKRNKLNMTFMHIMMYFLNWPSILWWFDGMLGTEFLFLSNLIYIINSFSCKIPLQWYILYRWVIIYFKIYFLNLFLNKIYWDITYIQRCYYSVFSAYM